MADFWQLLQRLVDSSEIIVDRPRGTTHPRYGLSEYPVSYGYLSGTTAADAGGVDIWVGSMDTQQVVGALCTVDLSKRDAELKIIYDCTEDEIEHIVNFANQGDMRAILLKRDE